MAFKEGPNFEDENRIREWAAEGKTAEEISQLLFIKASAIQNYLEYIDFDCEEEEDEED